MSEKKNTFKFSLRGKDSLASKWIEQKRATKGTLKENGANVFAIGDYIYEVFSINKLTDGKITVNKLYAKIMEINGLTKDSIVNFEDTIDIPFDHNVIKIPFEKGINFTTIANKLSAEQINDDTQKVSDVLTTDEIKIMAINYHHIQYDRRDKENIAGKTYDEIMNKPILYFANESELSFIYPDYVTTQEKKVVESTEKETPIAVTLTENLVQPEVNDTVVEGYFYKKTTGEADGKNKKYNGTSKKAYAVKEFKEKYYTADVIDLNISNDDLNIFANSTAKESSGNKKESYAIASTIVNLATYRNKTILNTLKTEGIYGYNDGGNSTSYKNNEKSSMEAVINALTNGKDNSNGAIRWDGFDLAAKGFNHVKAVDCGIRISETLFNSFKAAWSDDLINRYSGGKYTKFSDNFKAGDHKATGRNKGCICYEASAVEGLTMFWKKTDDPSFTGGYF